MAGGGGIGWPPTAPVPNPTSVPTYLVLGREGPTTLVPGDGGLSLAGHHAVQVQGLSLGDRGRRGLDADGRREAGGCVGRVKGQCPRPSPGAGGDPSPQGWHSRRAGSAPSSMVTTRDVSCVTPPHVTRHTYSPESAAVTCGMRRRVPDTLEGTTRGHISTREQARGQIQGDPPAPRSTWWPAGRDPPRLYQVTVAGPDPATTQLRSRVCPSAMAEDEDSMRRGWETPEAGGDRGRGRLSPRWHPSVPKRRPLACTHGNRCRRRRAR